MACVRRRRGRWVGDCRDRQGRRHREACRTRKAADALLARRLEEIRGVTYEAPGRERSFEEVADAFASSHFVNVRKKTSRDYKTLLRLHIRPYFAGFKLRDIRVPDVERFRGHLIERGVGERTTNKCLTLLRSLVRYAQRHEWTERNPTAHVAKIRRDVDNRDEVDAAIFTPRELRRLVDAAERRWRPIIETAYATGLRQGELLALTWNDIDWESGRVHVRRQYRGGRFAELKTKHARRTVPVPASTLAMLKRWRLECPNGDDDLVFPNGAGRVENPSNLLRRGFYPALRRAGLRRITFHGLRHCYASLMIATCPNLKIIQGLLGYASIHTTMNVYGHLLPDAIDGVAPGRDALLGGHQTVTSAPSGDVPDSVDLS